METVLFEGVLAALASSAPFRHAGSNGGCDVVWLFHNLVIASSGETGSCTDKESEGDCFQAL